MDIDSVSNVNEAASGSIRGITSLDSGSDYRNVTMKKEDFSGDIQSEIVECMDPHLYQAAAKGDFSPFGKLAKPLERIITRRQNTILHINIVSQHWYDQSTQFVGKILDRCPSLLLKVNAKGDTPLHVAAKQGYSKIVKFLIERAKAQCPELESGTEAAKQMLRMTNNEGNTALHEAVLQCYSKSVVEILTKEDHEFPYSANYHGETPLYLAAAAGANSDIVRQILITCESVAYEGPNELTALHAAVIRGDLASTTEILKKNKSLTKETDKHGWTPLHYAAYYDQNSITQKLLSSNRSAAYIADKERKMTALLLAASQGYKNIVKEIMKVCPSCCELVDCRGWNVLHFAMATLNLKELIHIVKLLPKNLLHEKDVKGITPFHVFEYVFVFEEESEQQQEVRNILEPGPHVLRQEIQELLEISSGPYNKGVIRKREKLEEEVFAQLELAKNSHLVVNTLIATVTFAAAFTLPGGYESKEGPNQGTAILRRNYAFQVFIISDATAMVLSLCAVFIYFIMSVKKYQKYLFLFHYAFWLTMPSMGAMVIAFVTGTYAVLSPSSWLAISTCAIGLSFFLWVFCMVIKKRLLSADAARGHESNKRITQIYGIKTSKKHE